MTYQQLLAHLLLLNEEQLQQEVTVYNCHAHVDEFYPVIDIGFGLKNDTIPEKQMYLTFFAKR